MNWEKKSNSANFFKGIFQDDDYCLTNEDNLLSISGYSKISKKIQLKQISYTFSN